MSEYKYKEYITDREGTTTGYKEIVVPNKVVEQIRTDVIYEIKSKAHCEDADCFECAFGSAKGCLLKEQK